MAKMGYWKERLLLVLHPYYALHLVSVLVYVVLRLQALPSISPMSQHTFLRWEAQAGLSLGLVLVVKFGRRNTLEGFLGDALLYVKCVLALLVAILDPRMLAWYLFTFSAIFLLWHQPTFTGSGVAFYPFTNDAVPRQSNVSRSQMQNLIFYGITTGGILWGSMDNVAALTPLQLEERLLENRSVAWLVEFGALWSPRCNHFRRIFAGLSLKYSNPTLRFGRIDVRSFPKTAAKYRIELGAALRQLPTLVLFEGGVEASRLPQASYEGINFVPALTESMVVQHFELDLKLIQALSKNAAVEQGESLAK